VQVDYSLPLSELGPRLVELCQQAAPKREETVMSYPSDHESELVRQDIAELEAGQKTNQPTFMVCPECGGSLWELRDGAFKKFQCRVGHRYSLQAALAEHRQQVERVLWVALRTLEEHASLTREVAHMSRQNGEGSTAEQFEREAQNIQTKSNQIKEMISGVEPQPRQPIKPSP
jgi:two-component system chemotaxis response regulator CheB